VNTSEVGESVALDREKEVPGAEPEQRVGPRDVERDDVLFDPYRKRPRVEQRDRDRRGGVRRRARDDDEREGNRRDRAANAGSENAHGGAPVSVAECGITEGRDEEHARQDECRPPGIGVGSSDDEHGGEHARDAEETRGPRATRRDRDQQRDEQQEDDRELPGVADEPAGVRAERDFRSGERERSEDNGRGLAERLQAEPTTICDLCEREREVPADSDRQRINDTPRVRRADDQRREHEEQAVPRVLDDLEEGSEVRLAVGDDPREYRPENEQAEGSHCDRPAVEAGAGAGESRPHVI